MASEGEDVAVYRQLLENHATEASFVRQAGRPNPAPQHASTGITRLDELLGGGLPAGTATLLFGPPFTGKGGFQRQFFLRGLQSRKPSLYILTDNSTNDLMTSLGRMDTTVPVFGEHSDAHYIDAYSRMIGDEEARPGIHFIDDLRSLAKVGRIADHVDNQLRAQGRRLERVVIQSLSTLMMEAGGPETFRFLRTIVGRIARRGGNVLAGLEAGMHSDPDVQAVKHLSNGMIQTRELDEKFSLRVEGLPMQYHPGWIDYEFSPERVELTGSFSSERIRGTALAP